MKFQTFSIVAGTLECNAHCPFCVAKMTPVNGIQPFEGEINWRNLDKACSLAEKCGVTTCLITGKGEPTIYPEEISKYVTVVGEKFPMVELQTNGILLDKSYDTLKELGYFKDWFKAGLTTIAISIVHYLDEKNKELCGYDFNLKRLIQKMHNEGFSVRLSCLLIKGYIETSGDVAELIQFAKDCNVEQLTIRTLEKPNQTASWKVFQWISKHSLNNADITTIKQNIEKDATKLLELVHGATVYDYQGQNVCITHALTYTPNPDEIRQLIYFPDGHLRYDWQYKGAILL